jgi:enoyl-CoA hydratase/carnithine racemase
MPAEDQQIRYQKKGKVGWLEIGQPCLTPGMVETLTALSNTLDDDEEVEIGVVTGKGSTFCTGLDYPPEYQGPKAVAEIRKRFGQRFGSLSCVAALARLTKPTLAAMNGDAVGVGLELALACDLRIGVSQARFGLPQIAEGLIPFCGGTQRLPRLVGQAKALEMVLTGELIDGAEAERIGLVNRLVAAGDFSRAVEELLSGLLAKGPIALRLGKEAVLKSLDLTLDQGLRLEEDLYVLLQTTQDRAEGIQSFLQRRTPRFVGK